MNIDQHYQLTTTCKCCQSDADLYGVCDFNKACNDTPERFKRLSGIPVWYYRCSNCGFIFTTDFDDWSIDDFKEHIYNDRYIEVDPDCISYRPVTNARAIVGLFGVPKRQIRWMDYGGGSGRFKDELMKLGYSSVESYDPFFQTEDEKPNEKYDVVTSYEVVEHVPDPYSAFEQMFSLLEPKKGILLFSTLLIPGDIDLYRLGWLYIAPRNGHISIHSQKSLSVVIGKFGYKFKSLNNSFHVAYKTPPSFAKKIFPEKKK